jgi:hypothetical protein
VIDDDDAGWLILYLHCGASSGGRKVSISESKAGIVEDSHLFIIKQFRRAY